MPYYFRLGAIPHKRHTQFRKPDGSLYSEEVIGAEGFSGIASIAYHLHPPTVVERIADPIPFAPDYTDLDTLRHRHIKGFEVESSGDWLTARRYIMGNEDVRLALAEPTAEMDYFYRNAVADEVVFIHDGEGVLESPFGRLEFSQGDYVHVPRTITHRWRFKPGIRNRVLIIESFSEVRFPKRYRNEFGQLLEHSPFCERDIRPPSELITIDEEGAFEVRIAKHGYLHRLFYRYHPFDYVGWDGYMYPYALSIHDFEPITGRIHQPPPVHQTFAGRNFVICSFVPRLFDYHPEAIPAPYNHSNIDSDEVLYYAEGDFMSRRGIERGSFTLHPGGIAHGPHPGTVEASIGKERTEELAVMVDTFRPLRLTKTAVAHEDVDYIFSWKPERHAAPTNGR
ncbi:homogentisate 1,2-dioxygenase [Rhodocaloribacter litoris]|uniref:homogentisate 1,2-dioxygenase n=1 Tax=Rhodocaloribacter litoris TaxID=2558931 RepID=UPI001422A4AA|nr:homogentisate 1,2-dioxygenase [Rhodocaloribacter litoris]QXD14924.1 homogentisate 1,2-dioxygenase [Rhodocaloribacter litoris]